MIRRVEGIAAGHNAQDDTLIDVHFYVGSINSVDVTISREMALCLIETLARSIHFKYPNGREFVEHKS
ncbi:MAG: hypothetical protein MN733_01115 [Nitrososphaera sp.]|nr:hypothetical protein [Nitrososphaera sp.]